MRRPRPPILSVLAFAAVSAWGQDVTYDQVRPLLERSCYKCHGEKRQRGDLRLDRWSEGLLEGTPAVLTPGHADRSQLIVRVTLPPDDPDFMPEGGEPLTAEEVLLLRRWMDGGAPWPKGPSPADVQEAVFRSQFSIPALDEKSLAARDEALDRLRALGAVAQVVAQDTPAVDVNLSLLGATTTDETLLALQGLETSLVWLNLSRTAVTDTGIRSLDRFPHLARLNLSRTAVTDEGAAVAAHLPKLRYLNLHSTAVTDRTLPSLAGLSDLTNLYLWETSVTDAGVQKLREALPQLSIDQGKYATPVVVETPKPVNDLCPVKEGQPVNGAITVTHENELIAFCCEGCKAAFAKDPAAYLAKLKRR